MERSILHVWNHLARTWAAVESDATYHSTMDTFIGRISELKPPKNRKFRILSLGSGPGLYETFLAYWLRSRGIPCRIYSVDYAEEMVQFQKELLSSDVRIGNTRTSAFRESVTPLVCDMTDLRQFHGTIDLVMCNNALQWVKEWKATIAESVRALNPNGLNALFLIVHHHAMYVRMNEFRISRDLISIEDILDEAEKNHFELKSKRILLGASGRGQNGGRMERQFLRLQLKRSGVVEPWRSLIFNRELKFLSLS